MINPQPGTFSVAHSIALVNNQQHVCVADRENGRIQCFTKSGDLIKIIENHTVIGDKIYAISYSDDDGKINDLQSLYKTKLTFSVYVLDVLFAINGPPANGIRTAGFTIKYETGKVVNSWEPSKFTDLSMPHDIAVSPLGDQVRLWFKCLYTFRLIIKTKFLYLVHKILNALLASLKPLF